PGWRWSPGSWARWTFARPRRPMPRRGEPASPTSAKLRDVAQVLAVGPRKQVMPVRPGHEVEIRHFRRVQRRLEAPPARGVDRSRREPGMEVGVVRRGELVVLLV